VLEDGADPGEDRYQLRLETVPGDPGDINLAARVGGGPVQPSGGPPYILCPFLCE